MGDVERKEASKMTGEPCRATRLQRLDCRAGNEEPCEAQPSVRPAGITSLFSHTLVSLSH